MFGFERMIVETHHEGTGYAVIMHRPGASVFIGLDHQPTDLSIRQELARRAFKLPGIAEAASGVSVPGARALVLVDEERQPGHNEAFLVGAEFAHFHPGPGYSMHLTLPEPTARTAVAKGWAESHPFVEQGHLPPTVVMVFTPRDRDELEHVWQLLRLSHHYATSAPEDAHASCQTCITTLITNNTTATPSTITESRTSCKSN